MALFGRRQVDARVTSLTWTRFVQLERQQWVSKRGSRVPSEGTRNVKKHVKTYWAAPNDPPATASTAVLSSSASATRTQLRTLVYYTYQALEWRTGRALNTSGSGRDDVAWPEVTLESGERIRDKKETYTVTFAAGDKIYQTTLPEQEWRALRPGGSCQLTLGMFGRVKKVTPAGTPSAPATA
jgi:hypothetical protein